MARRPRVLVLCGYFDWFSGYQEIALAYGLAQMADVEVVASDRVSPSFSDDNLRRLGVDRRYIASRAVERGLRVTRFPVRERRGMVWSTDVIRHVSRGDHDVIVQVMPGQILPAAGSVASGHAKRLVLYGDNVAMWAQLSPWALRAKGLAFALSKGLLYRFVNSRADRVYGYTPDTADRLQRYAAGKSIEVLPLSYVPDDFFFDMNLRARMRRRLSYEATDCVIASAGKPSSKKRLDLLLEAFRSLASENSSVKLLLIGMDSGRVSQNLKLRVEGDVLLKSRVQLMPFVDAGSLNEAFNAVDVGVWPRMPAITIQQAMGTGLRVALPKNDLVGHLLRPGSGDYFVPRDDEDWQSLERSLRDLVRTSPDSDAERQQRCVTNSWLSADGIARSLLADAGWGQQPQPSVGRPNGETG